MTACLCLSGCFRQKVVYLVTFLIKQELYHFVWWSLGFYPIVLNVSDLQLRSGSKSVLETGKDETVFYFTFYLYKGKVHGNVTHMDMIMQINLFVFFLAISAPIFRLMNDMFPVSARTWSVAHLSFKICMMITSTEQTSFTSSCQRLCPWPNFKVTTDLMIVLYQLLHWMAMSPSGMDVDNI